VLCKYRPLRRPDHSSGGVLRGVYLCLIVCNLETSTVRRYRPDLAVVTEKTTTISDLEGIYKEVVSAFTEALSRHFVGELL
jgi:hypothetical protein